MLNISLKYSWLKFLMVTRFICINSTYDNRVLKKLKELKAHRFCKISFSFHCLSFPINIKSFSIKEYNKKVENGTFCVEEKTNNERIIDTMLYLS